MALGLFALIALAGFTLLRSILDAEARTEARLARLSEIQRALFVIAGDLDQVSGRIEGGPDAIVFQKTDASGRPFVISYAVSGSTLTRTVASAGGERTQGLLGEVTAIRWSYQLSTLGWSPVSMIPPSPVDSLPGGPTPGPVVRAVALDLALAGPDGRPTEVRRVVPVPEIRP